MFAKIKSKKMFDFKFIYFYIKLCTKSKLNNLYKFINF